MEDKIFSNLMVDIETMGVKPYSSIISIGAVEFDLETGNTGRDFYVEISLKSCIDLGLGMDASTVEWWMQQSDYARQVFITDDKKHISEALLMFSVFVSKQKEYKFWSNSPSFDLQILSNAYEKASINKPWHFMDERCVRTLSSFNPEIKKDFYNDNLHNHSDLNHNALKDCYDQIKYCHLTWKSITK